MTVTEGRWSCPRCNWTKEREPGQSAADWARLLVAIQTTHANRHAAAWRLVGWPVVRTNETQDGGNAA